MPTSIEISLSAGSPTPIEVALNYAAAPVVNIELSTPSSEAIEISFANIGPKGDKGDAGEGTVFTATAGQDISSGRVIYIDGGEAFYYDPTDETLAGKVVGATTSAALTGDTVNVVLSGLCEVSGLGLTTDTVYYIGANGILTTNVAGLKVIQKAGVSITADKIIINFSSPIITI